MLSTEIVNEDNLSYLQQVSQPFDFNQDNALEVDRHIKHLIEKNNAFGISGIQFSFPYRVFGIYVERNIIDSFFNPVVLSIEDSTENREMEGCLSFPHLFLNKKRPSSILVEYQNLHGSFEKTIFNGIFARAFLHELDHLDGKVFIENVGRIALKMARKKQYNRKKKC